MMLLALHTSGSEGSVALAECVAGRAEIRSLQMLAAKTFAADLVPAVQRALAEAALAWNAIEAIAVATGPGSFTGIRIGMATAKGMAEPQRLPIIPVSSLAIIAMRLPHARAVLDAGRGDFYAGEFLDHGRQCAWQRWMQRKDLLQMSLPENCTYIACEPEVAETLSEAGHTVLLSVPPDAASVAKWAASKMLEDSYDFKSWDWAAADGNYLRRPEAEIKLEAAR